MEPSTPWKGALTASKAFIRFLEGLSDEQRESLSTGRAKISFDFQPIGNGTARSSDWSPIELVSKLNDFATREEAEEWITSASLTKRQFCDVLRTIDVPWDKNDNLERLRQKLIENTVGFKLRSRAIQGP